jgi:hypothetical protein
LGLNKALKALRIHRMLGGAVSRQDYSYLCPSIGSGTVINNKQEYTFSILVVLNKEKVSDHDSGLRSL